MLGNSHLWFSVSAVAASTKPSPLLSDPPLPLQLQEQPAVFPVTKGVASDNSSLKEPRCCNSNFCGHVYKIITTLCLHWLQLCAPVTELAPEQLQPAQKHSGACCEWQHEISSGMLPLGTALLHHRASSWAGLSSALEQHFLFPSHWWQLRTVAKNLFILLRRF